MKVLEIEPLEPLVLSKTKIGGAEVFSYISSLSIPLQTTIIGALGATLGIRLDETLDTIAAFVKLIDELYEACSATSRDRPLLWGPLIRFESTGGSIGYYIPVHDGFISYNTLIEKFDKEGYCVHLKHEDIVEFSVKAKIGITLERRAGKAGDKVIRYGYTYRYPEARYFSPKWGVVKPTFVYLTNCNVEIDTIARFGGEGRHARLHTTNPDELLRKIETVAMTPLRPIDSGIYVSVNYTPLLPLKDGGRDAIELDLQVLSGLEFLSSQDDVLGVLTDCGKVPTVRVMRLGLGYSEVAKARRPQVLALPPGTLYVIRRASTQEPRSKLTEYLWRAGFTSLIKLV